jgi:putative transposase
LKIILAFHIISGKIFSMKRNETYESIAHAKTRLRYHIILSTKYRKKCLNEIHESILEAFTLAEKNSSFKILTMELDKDHIHLLMKWKPSLSIVQVVRRLKILTTKYIWEKNEDYLKKYYWGNKRKLWSGGYFCSTIGDVSERTLKNYIENQG